MLKPVFYSVCVFLLCAFSSLNAQQNLVPNGGFEEYYNCPSTAQGYLIDACKYWTMPTQGTSDYFNACSSEFDSFLNSYFASVPENRYGNQAAKEGNAYAGFIFGGQIQEDSSMSYYSEYIHVKLNQALLAGKKYQLTFYAHNARTVCPNRLGVLFSQNQLNYTIDSILPIAPDYETEQSLYFCDTNKWYKVEYSFIANGTENFLTIGFFSGIGKFNIINYDNNPIYGADKQKFGIYFLVDDVALIEQEDNQTNVFTPNQDGINDSFSLNYYNIRKLTVFNRWGEVVYTSENHFLWDGNNQGEKCSDGVYFYTVELKNDIIKSGFLTLVR
jgi:gliding motility-associated-like protein